MKRSVLTKEQLQLGDFSIPRNLNDDNAKKAHQVFINFLKEREPDIFLNVKNDKVFSRECANAFDFESFDNALFFIHHYDERLNRWFSYDRSEDRFRDLFNYLRDWGFYVDMLEDNISAIFLGFGVKKYV